MTTGKEQLPPMQVPIFNTLRQLVDEVWQVEALCRLGEGQPRAYPFYSLFGPLAAPAEQEKGREWLGYTLSCLQDELEGDVNELSRQAALVYFRPFGWMQPYTYDFTRPEIESFPATARGEIIQKVLGEWLRLHPTIASRALLTERLETLLRGPGAKWKPDLHAPTLLDCLNLLLADPSPEASEILIQVSVGELGRAQKGSVEEPELRQIAPAIYLRLQQAKSFDYPIFRRAMFSLPGVYHDLTRPLFKKPTFYRDLPPAFSLELQSYAYQLATELAEKLPTGDSEAAALLKQVAYLQGPTWLLLACAYVEEKGLAKLPIIRSKQPASAATRLCRTHRPAASSAEEDAQTLEFLHHYKSATLQAVLPYALAYRDLIEQALAVSSTQ